MYSRKGKMVVQMGDDFQCISFEKNMVSEPKTHVQQPQKMSKMGDGIIFLDHSHKNVKFPNSNTAHIP